MLENQKLWIGPWALRNDSTASPARVIVDPGNEGFLGLARQRLQTASIWFGCLSRPQIEVCESEDESLIFTVSRTWGFGSGWLVCDADGQKIGTLRGCIVHDRSGHQLAVLEQSQETAQGRWVAADGEELGSFAADQQGILATFAPRVETDPFTKMLLLATLLRVESC